MKKVKKKEQVKSFIGLIRDMEDAVKYLDGLPPDQEWTLSQLVEVEDIRSQAISLKLAAEAILEEFQGG